MTITYAQQKALKEKVKLVRVLRQHNAWWEAHVLVPDIEGIGIDTWYKIASSADLQKVSDAIRDFDRHPYNPQAIVKVAE